MTVSSKEKYCAELGTTYTSRMFAELRDSRRIPLQMPGGASIQKQRFLLYFWALYDGNPSFANLPILQLLHRHYAPQGFIHVSVCCDPAEAKAQWQEFVQGNRLDGIQVLDRKWYQAFGKSMMPMAIIVDGEGTLMGRLDVKYIPLYVRSLFE